MAQLTETGQFVFAVLDETGRHTVRNVLLEDGVRYFAASGPAPFFLNIVSAFRSHRNTFGGSFFPSPTGEETIPPSPSVTPTAAAIDYKRRWNWHYFGR